MSELAKEFGGLDQLSVVDRTFIEQAAVLTLRNPHSHEDAVRCANTIRSLLTAVERRKGTGKPTEPSSLKDYVAAKVAQRDGKVE
jgi:hypothetical protein